MAIRPLLVTLKDTVAQELDDPNLSQAFRQIELWSKTVTEQTLVGLPPPTNSATTVVYTDPNTGVVYVAKAGVHGGQWRQARDALHARVYRNTAFTVSTVATTLTWDSTTYDPYGLLSGGVGFLIPVFGIYRVFFQVGATPTAAGQWTLGTISGGANSTAHASLAAPIYNKVEDVRQVASGSSFTINISAAPSLSGNPGVGNTYATIDYLGSG